MTYMDGGYDIWPQFVLDNLIYPEDNLMALNPRQCVGVLDRMITQLSETFKAFQEDKHPGISATIFAKVCSDMTMQLEALKMARGTAAEKYGDPAKEPVDGVVIRDNGVRTSGGVATEFAGQELPDTNG